MMRNRVQLMGNLGSDPEMKELQGGKRVVRLRVATNERFTLGDGQTKDDTQWHTVVAWGKTAEQAAETLHKGSKLALEGRLVHRVWETKDGQKRYSTEVVMNQFELVDPA
ncbi:MAG TPA: single-stranded DNA-binding protein [Flavobacteriales bacterium]